MPSDETAETSRVVAEQTTNILRRILASKVGPLPPKLQRFGNTEVHWFEGAPGHVVIMGSGGSCDDRTYAEQLVRIQLEGHGYKRQAFFIDGALTKDANWTDIMAKAKRLIQSGQVSMLRNGWNNIVAHVIGDHGEYNCEIGRDDPNSQAITTWNCECPWDQYAWGRSRQFKKFEGRPCAHVLAAFWRSKSVPLDDYDPNIHGPAPRGQRIRPAPNMGPGAIAPSIIPGTFNQGEPGDVEVPGPPGAPSVPTGPTGPRIFNPDGTTEGGPPAATGGPLAPPTAPGILPPSPVEQMAMMQPPMPGQTPAGLPAPPNSVSVPGARMPSPFNPLQFPGGTYSKVAAQEYSPGQPVILKNTVWGQMVGKSEAHGAGQYQEVPAMNSVTGRPQHAEVMYQDPTTGWVEIIVSNDQGKAMEPYHTQCFVEPSDIMPARNNDTGFIAR
jgi:hypothetical protein